MTIGISKKRLREWKRIAAQKGLDGIKSMEMLDLIINECKELDHWLPIEDAPRGRKILLFAGCPIIGWYNSINNTWKSTDSEKLYPTHYKELPENPKEI